MKSGKSAWIVAALCLIALGWIWSVSRAHAQYNARISFQQQADSVAAKLRERLLVYEGILHGARGLYAASKSVERSEWRAYIDSLSIQERYPGVRAFSFIAAVPRSELDVFLEKTRADGAFDFQIRSSGNLPDLMVVKYDEVFVDVLPPLGYDIASEPVRRSAAERARDTAEMTAMDKLALVTDRTEAPGFLLLYPVYKNDHAVVTLEQRRQAIQGWVMAVFRMEDFVRGVLADSAEQVDMDIFDGQSSECDRLLYGGWSCARNAAGGRLGTGMTSSISMEAGGRTWTLVFRPRQTFYAQVQDRSSVLVLIIGGVISLLLVGIVWSLGTTQIRATTLAEAMTHELRQAHLQLTQAAKLESTGRLAAGVAHEVKNPLAIMLMGLEYLAGQLEAHPDAEIGSVLKEMKQAVMRADSIVRGLLNFASQRELELQAEELNPVVENSLILVKHELDRAHVQVVKNLDPSLPKLLIDRLKLEQVFVNVFTNAAHAMPNGGLLTVTTARQIAQVTAQGSAKSARVVVVVDDTGSGIPKKLLAKIYDPFFTTKPTGQGTGLGLTVTQKIIELHSGTIEIQNRPEGGVRVILSFTENISDSKETEYGS